MNTAKKLLALLLALCLAVGLLAACGSTPTPSEPTNETPDETQGEQTPDATQGGEVSTEGPQYGGHMNVRLAAVCNGVDPTLQTGAWKLLYMTCVFESALTRDAENNIRPAVCDFELSDDQLDLKLWVRDGYTFSNGDAVDIYDVQASIDRALKRHSGMAKHVKPLVSSMEVENDGSKDILHITFKSFNELTMYYMASYQTWAAIQPKEICEKYASGFNVENLDDAIGTGPYKFTDFQDSVYITVTKRDDYVPVESEYSGFAGTKYGYMDSITFWYNGDDSSACMAVLNGDYDVTEVVPSDYKALAEDKGLTMTALPSDQRTWMVFNTRGTENLCAKYPSLRKAVLAAIDYTEFLDIITDGSAIYEGTNSGMVIKEEYATDAFTRQDYYGAANQDVVDKYLAAAEAEGYAGQPLQLVAGSGRDDVPTLLVNAMENYGINYKLTTLENISYNKFIGDPSNNWDFYFSWKETAYTPSLMEDWILDRNYKCEEKDVLLAEMRALDPTSDEYMAKWQELASLTADNAYIGYMSAIDWWWWHPETLVINNSEGMHRYMYNAYWTDPANHPAE